MRRFSFFPCFFIVVLSVVVLPGMALAVPITLVPSDLNPGDTYHLAFVTSLTRDASSSNIADYDAFAQAVANAAGAGLETITWKVIGSTASVNAIDHIGVAGPVYRLDEVRIANNLADLFDGSLAAPLSINEFGNPASFPFRVVTGTNPDGTASLNSLGTANVTIGSPFSTASTWLSFGTVPQTFSEKFYTISESLEVPSPQVVPEPISILLLASGLAGLAALRRMRKEV